MEEKRVLPICLPAPIKELEVDGKFVSLIGVVGKGNIIKTLTLEQDKIQVSIIFIDLRNNC